MLNNIFYFSLLLTVLLCLSCSDESTSPDDDQETGTMTDIDGNVYQTIKIGTQWWMAENLKVMHYSNGDTIPNLISSSSWANTTTGAWCCYNNDMANFDTYGLLYNWYTLADSLKLAPSGWHIPTDEEWLILDDYIGFGEKMKAVDTTLWVTPLEASNESGFSALPGGYREDNGTFDGLGYFVFFGSCSVFESDPNCVFGIIIEHGSSGEFGYYCGGAQRDGFSVRCVKD
jgi:uncharacterized protein (TIGR02145 family)